MTQASTSVIGWRVLVPMDGTELSQRALPWADHWAGALQGPVTLLYVRPPTPRVTFTNPDPAHVDPLATMEVVKGLFHKVTVVKVDTLVGTHAGEVLGATARESYDLVVMATHTPSGMPQFGDGSVAAHVIRTAGTPVLVIPAGMEREAAIPRRVLVPLDGSQASGAILPIILPLAQTFHWTVQLLGVLDPNVSREDAISLTGYMEQVAAVFDQENVAARVVIREGEVGPTILGTIDAVHAETIAMSTRSQPEPNPFHIGGVTRFMMAHSTVPVLTLHPLDVKFAASPFETREDDA